LLATIATTLDANNNPIIFSIGANGVVSDTRQVPTNNPVTPYQSNGLETLPGLKATTIAAYQLPDGTPVVLAMNGAESWVYLDEYESTANPALPHAWSGWTKISDFVATSIVAVGATNGSGPAIFAIGTNSEVYEDLYSSTLSPSPYSDFQPLAGLGATSIAAIADGSNTFRVLALTGPESYVYQATTTLTDGSIESSGWSTLNNEFVASSISVSTGPTAAVEGASSPNTLMVFATGAGFPELFTDTLTLNTNTGQQTDGGFQVISLSLYTQTEYENVTPLTAPLSKQTAIVSGDELTLFALSSGGDVFENQYLLTGLVDQPSYWVGWQELLEPESDGYYRYPLTASDIAATVPPGGGVEVVTNNNTNSPEIATAPAHAAISFPGYTPIANTFSPASSLLSTGTHPIVTTIGPSGRAVVFAIGSDGTVSESQDTTPGTGVTTTRDTYSALTPLPGLQATSIAATTEPNGIAVFALTKSISLVFENQYRPTSDGSYAWTGWEQIDNFVATSIAAATGGDSANNGPTVFAIGTNGGVYYDASIAGGLPTDNYVFGNFGLLNGLGASTISVRSTSTGIEVAALTGPQSYAYVNLDTAASWSGWQQAGNYVMNQILATTTASGGPAVAGVSPVNGAQVFSDYVPVGEFPVAVWGTYQTIAFSEIVPSIVVYYGSDILKGFTAVTLPDQAGVVYYDLINSIKDIPENGVSVAYSFPDSSSATGPTPTDNFNANSLTSAPDGLQPTFYIVGTDGNLYVNQAVASGNASAPYNYLGYVSLGSLS
jgi:hypothetical protein